MKTLSRLVHRFRILILVLTAAMTVWMATRLPTLEADDDVMQFLPQEDPDVKLFNRVNTRFGGLDVAIIGLEADTMLSRDNIDLVRHMTRRIADIEGVYDVLSFTEIPDPQPAPDGLRVTPLVMDRIPEEGPELEALRQRILSNENAVGNLISRTGDATMILCFLGGTRSAIHIAQDIKDAATALWQKPGIYYGGSPFIRLHLAGGTKKDISRLTPLVALVVLLVTFIVFRKPVGVLLALGTVGVAIVWLMGFIALKGEGLTLVGSSLPTILMAIGGAYGIHMLAGFFNARSETVPARIEEMLCNMGPPVIASALTTSAGFLSFLAMDIEPLRDFGLQAAIGVSITALLSVTAIPAILSFSRKVPGRITEIFPAGPLGRIGGFAAQKRVVVLLCCALVAGVSLLGILRIAPDATLESFFAEDSEPDQANRFLIRHFGGATYLQVYFEGDMRSPFVLLQLQKIVEFARSLDEVEQVSSITDSLIMMSQAMGGRTDIPETNRRAGALYPFLEGTAAIEQMISREKDASLVQIRLRNIGPDQVDATVRQLRQFIETEIPRGIKAVQVSPFPLPESGETAYTSPAEYDRDGNETHPEKPTMIHQPANDTERQTLRHRMRLETVKRLSRLTRIHLGQTFSENTQREVLRLLAAHDPDVVPPGPDLTAMLKDLIDEHLIRDPAFHEPERMEDHHDNIHDNEKKMETSAALEAMEWTERAGRVLNVLSARAGHFIDEPTMRTILEEALPLTAERDMEGLDITAQSMSLSLSQRRSELWARRVAPSVFQAMGITALIEPLKSQLIWALTDLDLPVFGFPDVGSDSTTVLARVTGAPVINVALCTSTISNQLKSLSVSVVILLVIMSLLFRSVISAAKGLLPALLMMAMAIGVMGALSIPIDLTTSMIAAIAIGIGVDYAIHFLWRRRRRGETLSQTTAGVGPSIISNAVQVSAGFAVLCLSDMVPIQRFGMLVAMTMLLTATATFVMLPALRAEGREQHKDELDTLHNQAIRQQPEA